MVPITVNGYNSKGNQSWQILHSEAGGYSYMEVFVPIFIFKGSNCYFVKVQSLVQNYKSGDAIYTNTSS